MPIDPKVEAPLREMLGHAIRVEMDDLYALVAGVGAEAYEATVNLAILAAGYIAVDTPGRWPTGADVKALAKHAAGTRIGKHLTEDEIASFLSRVVLGSESPLTVFEGDEKAALIPVLATASLLAGFGPAGQSWADYLDTIWNSLDAAESVKAPVVSAVIYLAEKQRKK